jgi:hypothetical protein
MVVRSLPESFLRTFAGIALLAGASIALMSCERGFQVTPAERVGYLRELVRARTVSRDTLPIDGCSVTRFMDGVPAWRDSLVAAEKSMIVDSTPCPAEITSVRGRFVLTRWYRNWSGEYVIRGATYPWDQGYRFTDGIYVGREDVQDQKMFAGNPEPRKRPAGTDSLAADSLLRGDSIRRAGTVADSADSLRR